MMVKSGVEGFPLLVAVKTYKSRSGEQCEERVNMFECLEAITMLQPEPSGETDAQSGPAWLECRMADS